MSNDSTVTIPCPRCSGQGFGSWQPSQGRCYRCKGAGQVEINVALYTRALQAKRAEYRRLRAEGANEETLAEIVEAGFAIRAALEAAGALH